MLLPLLVYCAKNEHQRSGISAISTHKTPDLVPSGSNVSQSCSSTHSLGLILGSLVGFGDGCVLGSLLGLEDGVELGFDDGIEVGALLGTLEG